MRGLPCGDNNLQGKKNWGQKQSYFELIQMRKGRSGVLSFITIVALPYYPDPDPGQRHLGHLGHLGHLAISPLLESGRSSLLIQRIKHSDEIFRAVFVRFALNYTFFFSAFVVTSGLFCFVLCKGY